jgi:hypothetical protein
LLRFVKHHTIRRMNARQAKDFLVNQTAVQASREAMPCLNLKSE